MSFKVIFLILCTLFPISKMERAEYNREFHVNGNLKAEGWLLNNQKIKYWKFYNSNEVLTAEGHFDKNLRDGYWHFYNSNGKKLREGLYELGIAQEWWIFYDIARQEKRKIQFVNNVKHGFCLIYQKTKLTRVEKFEKDQRVGTWTSLRSFRRDNPEVSLLNL